MDELISDISFDKGEEELISGEETKRGLVSFKYKGKEYEVEYYRISSWEKNSGEGMEMQLDQPKEISDDDWDEIEDIIETELL